MEKDDDFTDWLIAREECIMDLDDEELKATRKLNGVAKESNIEEDIKRCEKLIEPQNANWIGITNQLAIAHLIEKVKELRAMCEEYCPKTERIKELEEENHLQRKQIMSAYDKGWILKQKVKDKIEEINKENEENKDENGESEYYYPDYTIRKLEELLEDK